jgi:hypothetical protein
MSMIVIAHNKKYVIKTKNIMAGKVRYLIAKKLLKSPKRVNSSLKKEKHN